MNPNFFLNALIYFLLESQEFLEGPIEDAGFERWPCVTLALKFFVDYVVNVRRSSKILLVGQKKCANAEPVVSAKSAFSLFNSALTNAFITNSPQH